MMLSGPPHSNNHLCLRLLSLSLSLRVMQCSHKVKFDYWFFYNRKKRGDTVVIRVVGGVTWERPVSCMWRREGHEKTSHSFKLSLSSVILHVFLFPLPELNVPIIVARWVLQHWVGWFPANTSICHLLETDSGAICPWIIRPELEALPYSVEDNAWSFTSQLLRLYGYHA